jgi:hypothetical protein
MKAEFLGGFFPWLWECFTSGHWAADVPTWIIAIATSGAVLGAWVASQRLVSIERTRDKAATTHAERTQAEQVGAWIDWETSQMSRPGGWTVHILNASLLPIYDVVVDVYGPNGDLRGTIPSDPRLVPPGLDDRFHGVNDLNPGERREGRRMRAAIRFRDSGNRLWIRNRFGVLDVDTDRPLEVVAADGASIGVTETQHVGEHDAPPSDQTH